MSLPVVVQKRVYKQNSGGKYGFPPSNLHKKILYLKLKLNISLIR